MADVGPPSAADPQSFTFFHRTPISSIMSKPCLIDTFLHPQARIVAACAIWAGCALSALPQGWAQDEVEAPQAEPPSPQYPRAVAVEGSDVYTVDLDLPGVWKTSPDGRQLFVRGSNLLRKTLNRPWSIALHPEGGILVGDSATREIYRIAAADAEPEPLNDGYLGIPMALVVDPAGKTIYVGDAERRALFRLPIEGGKPELVARVNARGLAFDPDGKLWAVTPDDEAVVRIDVETNEAIPVVTGRPFQFPNGLAWAGDHGYVTDIYSKAIWKFTADGKTEKWFEGDPLVGPVGITATETSLFVADPKVKQVFEINLETKEVKERL